MSQFSLLRFFDGAQPGKKRPSDASEQSGKKKKGKDPEYEKKRPKRTFSSEWKTDLPWLVYDEKSDAMTCTYCIDFKASNTFVDGCNNLRKSAVTDHECSHIHRLAADAYISKQKQATTTNAGRALLSLKESERHKLVVLFRNVHAVGKQNRPFTDYTWLCQLDIAKGLQIGETYLNNKSAFNFLQAIELTEREKVLSCLSKTSCFSLMMDGSTDITGLEQESVYVRYAKDGKVHERFLHIGSPRSTSAVDLLEHLKNVFDETGLKSMIEKGKLIGMGSDGASNMTGVKGGLATLLKKEHPEMINIHCLCHRLELSFRDAMKSKLYDKMMTLLTGLYYFNTKSSKQKKALEEAMTALDIKGTIPSRVTGTRWMPHLKNAITSLLRTYPVYNVQLSTASHGNAKAEGLAKLLLNKSVMAFVFVSQSLLDPLMRMSLKMQRVDTTLADALHWVECTVTVLRDEMDKNSTKLQSLLDEGRFCDVDLKGPTHTLSYRKDVVDKLVSSITSRFKLESPMNVISATRISCFNNWPMHDSDQMRVFGTDEIAAVTTHFEQTLAGAESNFNSDEAQREWTMLKYQVKTSLEDNIYKKTKHTLTWCDVDLTEFPNMATVVDLLLSLPPTSVSKCLVRLHSHR